MFDAIESARRLIWAEYVALISMLGADFEYEWLVYQDVILDLETGPFVPAAVAATYVGFRASDGWS